LISSYCGQKRMHCATISVFPAASAAAIIWLHSPGRYAIGFSVMTCLPFCNAATAIGACSGVGSATSTTSTFGSRTNSSGVA